jgi:hypothetical protein
MAAERGRETDERAGGGYKKGRQRKTACRKGESVSSDVGLGLAETLHAIAGLPLTALLEQIDALEALQDVALDDETRGTLEAFVLRHGIKKRVGNE